MVKTRVSKRRLGPVLPESLRVRPCAWPAPHLRLLQQRSTRGFGGRVEAALQGAQRGWRKRVWHGWVCGNFRGESQSPVFLRFPLAEIIKKDNMGLLVPHVQTPFNILLWSLIEGKAPSRMVVSHEHGWYRPFSELWGMRWRNTGDAWMGFPLKEQLIGIIW